MAVKIRLSRFGKTGTAFYRVVAIDEHFKRDGRAIEVLGTYDPHSQIKNDKLKIKNDRVKYWLSVGARPTPTVERLLK
jgi:small subunit ribosomal protein S16